MNRSESSSAPPTNIGARRAHSYLARSILAIARTYVEGTQDCEGFIKRTWPNDRVTPLVTRAAVSPASTVTTGWAADTAAGLPFDVISNLGPASAGSQLLAAGLNLRFNGYAAITVPGVSISPVGIGFVAQAAPIPARNLDTSPSLTLTPAKLAVIFSLTNELIRNSNAEALVKAVASENISAALDAALFSTQAGTSDQPSGLLRAAPTLAATGNAAGVDSLRADLGKLAAAVAPIGGDQIAFVSNPANSVKIQLALGGANFPYRVFSSGQVAVGTVIAIAIPALASATADHIRIDVSKETTVHQETAPTQGLVEGGSFQAGAAVRSYFQTDTIGIKIALPISWGLRDATGIAQIVGVNW
jgi:hypothetical protein